MDQNSTCFPDGPPTVGDPDLPALRQRPLPAADVAHPGAAEPRGEQGLPRPGGLLRPPARRPRPLLPPRLGLRKQVGGGWHGIVTNIAFREKMYYTVSDCDNNTNIYQGNPATMSSLSCLILSCPAVLFV